MKKSIVAAALVIAAALYANGQAIAKSGAPGRPACSAAISACGCMIKAAGLYKVTQPLSGTSGSDCIQIKIASAVLNLQGNAIAGDGGIGIHVLRGSSSLMLEGQGAAISGFSVGIQVEGNKVVGEHFDLSNNLQQGLAMINVKQVLFTDIKANNNGGYGVLISGAGTNEVSSLKADLNGGTGVLIRGSSTNLINKFEANENTVDGVLITCAPGKRGGCGAVSGGNLVYDGVASSNGQFGIEIGKGNTKSNLVADNTAQKNSSPGGIDLQDDNPACGGLLGNNWFTNVGVGYPNASPSCVH